MGEAVTREQAERKKQQAAAFMERIGEPDRAEDATACPARRAVQSDAESTRLPILRHYVRMAFLSKIRTRDAVLKAIRRYDELGEEQFFETYDFGRPREYFIKHRGKLYPSKAILGVAYGFEDPGHGPLRPNEYSGGRAAAAQRLVALNFDIVKVMADGSEVPVRDTREPSSTESPEVSEATEFLGVLAGRSSTRQGFAPSLAARRAIEERAMKLAAQYYRKQGWKVDPSVARNNSFDLLCKRDKKILHVEVKGTTGDGVAVLLTPNEVEHAHVQHPNVALVVVAQIRVTDEPELAATGGNLTVYDPWKLDETRLQPIGFSYTIPS